VRWIDVESKYQLQYAKSALARPRHPNKHIEAAVVEAERRGFWIRISAGHAWGVLFCPYSARGSCKMSILSTPRNPQNHAKQIRRFIAACPHI
jgi:hypothetical protein